MARKNQQSSKKNHCDICGTVLTEEAVVQEFPDGSLARLCQECAEAAAPSGEMAENQYDVAEDATKEWANPADDEPSAFEPPPEDPPSRRKRAKTSAKKTEEAPEIFEADVFDPELFDLERAAPTDIDTHLDSQERATSGAEAELAAWASAESTDDVLAEDPESGYESEADFDSEVTREEAHDAELELAAAIAEADLAAASGAEATSVTIPPEPQFTAADFLEETAELTAEIEPDISEEGPAASETEITAKTDVAAELVAEATAAAEPEPAEVQAEVKAEITAGDEAKEEAEGIADEEEADEEAADKTKELLMPVSDLISLQTEMQSALAKLSSTLEHFVTEMVTSDDQTARMAERLHQLEEELETTRERLRVTEALLPAAGEAAPDDASDAEEPTPATDSPPESEPVESAATVPPPLPAPPVMPPPTAGNKKGNAAAPPPLPEPSESPGDAAPPPLPTPEATGEDEATAPPPLPGAKTTGSAAARVAGAAAGAAAAAASALGAASAAGAAAGAAPAAGAAVGAGADAAAPPPIPTPPTQRPTPGPSGAAAAVQRFLRSRKAHQEPPPEPESTTVEPEGPGLAFQINEVQAAQRHFNGSVFVKKIRDINRSIGKPKANLSRVAEGQPQAVVTVFWDIVWYQYLVDLRKELPAGSQRIVLDREGMDLEELEPRFREKNATVNDDGRLDASELEVGLLSDPSALITEMDPVSEETVVQEDATEEIWDQQSAPEFRWD